MQEDGGSRGKRSKRDECKSKSINTNEREKEETADAVDRLTGIN